MTPAERDDVREVAQIQIDHHHSAPVVSQAGKAGCRCTECMLARAVLRYVPPGDAADSSIVPYAAGRDAWIAMHLTGSAKPDAARRLAHALHAAADAAEENDR